MPMMIGAVDRQRDPEVPIGQGVGVALTPQQAVLAGGPEIDRDLQPSGIDVDLPNAVILVNGGTVDFRFDVDDEGRIATYGIALGFQIGKASCRERGVQYV